MFSTFKGNLFVLYSRYALEISINFKYLNIYDNIEYQSEIKSIIIVDIKCIVFLLMGK